MQHSKNHPQQRPTRAMCYRCFKPRVVCICDDIVPVHNRTGVIVLQHPRERNHAIGTARLVRLGLRRSQIRPCGPNNPHQMMRASQMPPGTAMLYPAPGAIDLAQVPAAKRPKHIVVIDGTWGNAHALVRSAPWLDDLPKFRLTPTRPSQYRIRKEPRAECLSTLEAIVEALRILEPNTLGFDGLLDAFHRMIDRQILLKNNNNRARSKRPRATPPAPIPKILQRANKHLVLVQGEVTSKTNHQANREIIYWIATRPATGEIFECSVRPTIPAAHTELLKTSGLPLAAIERGVSYAEWFNLWQQFLREDDILGSWNQSCLSWINHQGPQVLLKAVYCNLIGKGCGHLADVLHEESLSQVTTPFLGRAGQRMGQTLAVLTHLHHLATSSTQGKVV